MRVRARDTHIRWCSFVPACIAASLMPREQLVTLYVKPYIRRFVQRKLSDAGTAATDAVARTLWQELERILHVRVIGVVQDSPTSTAVPWHVQLVVDADDPSKLDPIERRRVIINALLNRTYYADMAATVSLYRRVLGLKLRHSILRHQQYYGITEEHQSMRTAERLYYRWQDLEGRKKKRTHADRTDRA